MSWDEAESALAVVRKIGPTGVEFKILLEETEVMPRKKKTPIRRKPL